MGPLSGSGDVTIDEDGGIGMRGPIELKAFTNLRLLVPNCFSETTTPKFKNARSLSYSRPRKGSSKTDFDGLSSGALTRILRNWHLQYHMYTNLKSNF